MPWQINGEKMSSDASTYLMCKMTAKSAQTCKVCDNARIILHCMKKDIIILKVIIWGFFYLDFSKVFVEDDHDDR